MPTGVVIGVEASGPVVPLQNKRLAAITGKAYPGSESGKTRPDYYIVVAQVSVEIRWRARRRMAFAYNLSIFGRR